MECPTCGSWSRVLRTKDKLRRRECANGHRFLTLEILSPERNRSAAKKLGNARKILREKGYLK